MMKPEAIFFDFGDVLVFYDHMRSCKALAAYTSVSADEIYRIIFGNKLEEKEYNRGAFDDKEWYELCVDLLKLRDCPYDVFAEKWGDIFTPNPKIEIIFKSLRPEIKVFVLSNTNGLHWKWAQKNIPVLTKYFSRSEQAILSSEEKSRKPEELIYRRALLRAGVEAENAVFIDDKLVNIKAFQHIGGEGIVYSASTSEITSLRMQLQHYGCIQ